MESRCGGLRVCLCVCVCVCARVVKDGEEFG